MPNDDDHTPDYDWIAREMQAGAIVPFLGAGASFGRGLPLGGQLAELLIKAQVLKDGEMDFPDPNGRSDLARVASWLAIRQGSPWLKRELRKVVAEHKGPGILHTYLASLPKLSLVVTTNYDDLVETAIEQRWVSKGRNPHEQPWVVVDRAERGFVSVRAMGSREWKGVEVDKLEGSIEEEQPIVYKMHGSMIREREALDEFLITEEHYIDFLGRGEKIQIPPAVEARMLVRHMLFLGYGLRDWNVRVLMFKLQKTRRLAEHLRTWAIVHAAAETARQAREAEKFLWKYGGVTLFEADLDAFVAELTRRH
jgi:hypothetical protein